MSACSMRLELASTHGFNEHRTAACEPCTGAVPLRPMSACSQPHRNLFFLAAQSSALNSLDGPHARPRPHPPDPRRHSPRRRRPPLFLGPSSTSPGPPPRRHRPPRRKHHLLLPNHNFHRPERRPHVDPLADLPLPPLARIFTVAAPLRLCPHYICSLPAAPIFLSLHHAKFPASSSASPSRGIKNENSALLTLLLVLTIPSFSQTVS